MVGLLRMGYNYRMATPSAAFSMSPKHDVNLLSEDLSPQQKASALNLNKLVDLAAPELKKKVAMHQVAPTKSEKRARRTMMIEEETEMMKDRKIVLKSLHKIEDQPDKNTPAYMSQLSKKSRSGMKDSQSNPGSLAKIQRVLNVGLFCVKMEKINEGIRKHGTSSLLYNPVFKSRWYIRNKLKRDLIVEDVVEVPRFMFHPEHKLFIVWSLIGFVLILYAVTFMPYGMLFMSDNVFIDRMETYMNFYFIADIFVNFNTALIDKENK